MQGWSHRSRQFATLLLVTTVLICIITATANAGSATGSSLTANATTSTQSSVGATTHPIEYHIGCPPSMVNDGSLDYFKSHGFTTVHLVVPDKGTYQAELNKIKSLGMKPIIDVEVPIWNGGQLQGTPITSFAAYFQSLKNAGWEYVSSEGGRAGDLDYMAQFFKGYVNYNCDQCGLWKDMYKHSFTVMNSWESYYTQEVPYIQTGAKEAASLGKQNGILAGVWEGGYNPILTNSKNGGSPSYKSMLDWSYANGIGFNHFHVWCGLNSQGLSRYKELGFEQVVSNLQTYYPATSSASGQSTQTTFSASTTAPAVGQSVTFTATLKSGTTPLTGKPVTIYHYLNNVRYTDTAKTTTTAGQITLTQTFSSAGQRTYYATFAGDKTYKTSTSSVVTINVKIQTGITIIPSSATPTVGQSVTFTATLKSGTTPLSSKPVTIYHYLNNVRYTDTTKTTNANGQITFAQSFGSAGPRTYYATFAGDNTYAAKTSSVLTITVH